MKKIYSSISRISIFIIIIALTITCEKNDSLNLIQKEKLIGYVQKGPFIVGTQVLMTELNMALEQTGKNFIAQIQDDKGYFEINNLKLTSKYVELSAIGFYYNEVDGKISPSQLNLFTISDIKDISTTNVNILTHIEIQRVKYLVANGRSFAEAKKQAQNEVLAIFGIKHNTMQSSESLNISANSDDGAILLAISIILQGKRSVGDLTELLATISNDIRSDGVLSNQKLLFNLRDGVLDIDLSKVRENLQSRYKSLNMDITIPDFEKYIDIFKSHTTTEPSATTTSATKITSETAILNGIVNPQNSLTNVIFEYGTTPEYGKTLKAQESPITGVSNNEVSVKITGLSLNTTYHFRVKSENARGVTYGQNYTFTTVFTGLQGTVDDVTGNTYQTIGIGHQIWMAENLRTTKYNDGSDILTNLTDEEWKNSTQGAYTIFPHNEVEGINSEEEIITKFGLHYNWYTVETEKLCPVGWRVPTDTEWIQLNFYLIRNYSDITKENYGNKLKSCRQAQSPLDGSCNTTEHPRWNSDLYEYGTDDFGFSALPMGFHRHFGGFAGLGHSSSWWSATEDEASRAWDHYICNDFGYTARWNQYKASGLTVRCIKDL